VSATTGIGAPRPRQSLREWVTNPWAETRFLWVVGIGYVLWPLIPVAEAVLFSVNKGVPITQGEGLAVRSVGESVQLQCVLADVKERVDGDLSSAFGAAHDARRRCDEVPDAVDVEQQPICAASCRRGAKSADHDALPASG